MGVGKPKVFRGCDPEVACDGAGRIIAVGHDVDKLASAGVEIVECVGRTLPGLADSHIHLAGLADELRGVQLRDARSAEAALESIRRAAVELPADEWVLGDGWSEDRWSIPKRPNRQMLDSVTGGRPAIMGRRDGHSAWVNSSALAAAGVTSSTPNPPGGVIERDPSGEANGILLERAISLVERMVPVLDGVALDRALVKVLARLSAAGLTSVHAMDPPTILAALQRLRREGKLGVRVVYNLPADNLGSAMRLGVSSGFGDPWIRLWGVKAFLDGSLGSGTAYMLDGTGVARMLPSEFDDIVRQCREIKLNVCVHAIGDGAVRRALDAFEPYVGTLRDNSWWRPRIEHAQCVDPADLGRFGSLGVIASMQPVHAVSDRDLADERWGKRAANSYAWGALLRAGARVVFGSDAPVETFSPFEGIEAATKWRHDVSWYSELAISRARAIEAYTRGPAFASGTERTIGSLRPGYWCDLTIVDGSRVVATIVAGQVTHMEDA